MLVFERAVSLICISDHCNPPIIFDKDERKAEIFFKAIFKLNSDGVMLIKGQKIPFGVRTSRRDLHRS